MIKYFCDRCGEQIVNNNIYHISITFENIAKKSSWELLNESVRSVSSSISDRIEQQPIYCEKCKEEIEFHIVNKHSPDYTPYGV